MTFIHLSTWNSVHGFITETVLPEMNGTVTNSLIEALTMPGKAKETFKLGRR
ncbi:MAG: hypothetical protein ACTSP4_07735 [Candidatus Hodarchaeales archaeon]